MLDIKKENSEAIVTQELTQLVYENSSNNLLLQKDLKPSNGVIIPQPKVEITPVTPRIETHALPTLTNGKERVDIQNAHLNIMKSIGGIFKKMIRTIFK